MTQMLSTAMPPEKSWLSELPENKQRQVKHLRRPIDQYLSLAGLQLLKRAVTSLSSAPFSLKDLQYPKNGKPFIEGKVDFNISHSGEIVVCAVSDTLKIGIDIELQRQVYPGMLKKVLGETKSKQEGYTLAEFFSAWTKKEAIIKAANSGSVFNFQEIQLNTNGGYYNDHDWHCYPVKIISGEAGKEYTCHIACSDQASEITIQHVHKL